MPSLGQIFSNLFIKLTPNSGLIKVIENTIFHILLASNVCNDH